MQIGILSERHWAVLLPRMCSWEWLLHGLGKVRLGGGASLKLSLSSPYYTCPMPVFLGMHPDKAGCRMIHRGVGSLCS